MKRIEEEDLIKMNLDVAILDMDLDMDKDDEYTEKDHKDFVDINNLDT